MKSTKYFERFPTAKELKADAFGGKSIEYRAVSFDRWLRDNLPPESAFQERIIKELKTWAQDGHINSLFFWKTAAGVYGRAGLPDIVAVVDGAFIAFEVKRPYLGKLTKLQEDAIEKINAAGGYAGHGSYPSELRELIKAAGKWIEKE